jgi:hypothetical protein
LLYSVVVANQGSSGYPDRHSIEATDVPTPDRFDFATFVSCIRRSVPFDPFRIRYHQQKIASVLPSLPTSDHPVTLTNIPSKQPTCQPWIVSILRPSFLASDVPFHLTYSEFDTTNRKSLLPEATFSILPSLPTSDHPVTLADIPSKHNRRANAG